MAGLTKCPQSPAPVWGCLRRPFGGKLDDVKTSQARQEGATLIVTTMLVLLLLTALFWVTAVLTVQNSRTTNDHRATLGVQYAAESGRAYIDQRLFRAQSIFSGLQNGNAVVQTYLAIPPTVSVATLKGMVSQYCGNTAWTTSSSTDANGAPISVSQCNVPAMPTGGYAANSTQFDIFNTYYAPSPAVAAGTQNYPYPSGTPDTLAGRRAYWNQLFGTGITVSGSTGSGTYTAVYSLTPVRAVQTGSTNFRLYMRPNVLSSVGSGNGSTRLIKGNSTTASEFYVQINLPVYTDRVLFTNHHKNKAGRTIVFNDQQFDGPVHTNEAFTFYPGSTASFTKVTSAGCNFPSLTSNDCSSKSPKATINNYSYTSVNGINNALATTAVTISQSANWNADYQAMPDNNQDQQAAATSGGLTLSNVTNVTLKAGDISGNSPATFNTSTKSWEPAPSYQYITTTAGATITEYRYGSDKVLYKKVNGSWTVQKQNFNGVVYSPTATSVSGPTRNAMGVAPPAIAPFAGMTVAGSTNITINNDLTYSDVPCKAAEPCSTKPMPDNILGIYSQSGDIVINQSAPSNLNIHAALMASTGEVTVQNYNTISNRGNVNLIGGLIENYYGAFGTVGSTPTNGTGYGRNFAFDDRMSADVGMSPPYFPTASNWTITASNLNTVAPTSLLNTFWNQDKK